MNNYQKSSRLTILLSLFFALTIIILIGSKVFISIREHERIEEKIAKEYRLLILNDSINSVISSTYYPEGWRGWEVIQNVKLESGNNFTIRIGTNITSQDVFFGEIVKSGVILKKNRGSDTLTVIVDNKEYKYLIICNE